MKIHLHTSTDDVTIRSSMNILMSGCPTLNLVRRPPHSISANLTNMFMARVSNVTKMVHPVVIHLSSQCHADVLEVVNHYEVIFRTPSAWTYWYTSSSGETVRNQATILKNTLPSTLRRRIQLNCSKFSSFNGDSANQRCCATFPLHHTNLIILHNQYRSTVIDHVWHFARPWCWACSGSIMRLLQGGLLNIELEAGFW